MIEVSIEGRIPARDTQLVVYCAGGVRSDYAAKTLQDLGYSNVASMDGGFGSWKMKTENGLNPCS